MKMIDCKWIDSWAKENKYGKNEYGKNSRLIIVGESHAQEKLIRQQEILIDKTKPEYILSEIIGIQTYNPETKRESYPEGRKIDETDLNVIEDGIDCYMKEWANKYKCNLIGIDISCGEMEKLAPGLLEKFPQKYKMEYDMIVGRNRKWEINLQNSDIVPYRDKQMASMMVNYYNKTNSNKSNLVAIIGSHHIRSDSPIHSILKKEKISYLSIIQSEKNC